VVCKTHLSPLRCIKELGFVPAAATGKGMANKNNSGNQEILLSLMIHLKNALCWFLL
jgi:hypothetical protein